MSARMPGGRPTQVDTGRGTDSRSSGREARSGRGAHRASGVDQRSFTAPTETGATREPPPIGMIEAIFGSGPIPVPAVISCA